MITSNTELTEKSTTEFQPLLTTEKPHELHLYSLILSATGISHKISHSNHSTWNVHVAPQDLEHAKWEIQTYNSENINWPIHSSSSTDSFSPFFRVQSVVIVISLALFFSVTGPWSQHSPWFTEGAINSSNILEQSQYYRLLTALTLHADLVHLLGNCMLGGFLLHFYFLLLGNGIGIASLITTSVAANYLNVLLHGTGHNSVGFSTAVFSVIGILSALNYRHYKFSRPERLVLPIMAGATMLAMLGSSGERTDLGAHFFGLLVGLVCGSILGFDRVFSLRYNRGLQFGLTAIFGLTPVLAWYFAMI